MAKGRMWTVVSVCLGAGSLALSVWSLSVLSPDFTIAPPGFVRALFLCTPASLLLLAVGIVCGLIGLVRTKDGRALVGIGVCLVAMMPAAVLTIVALGRLTALA